MAIRFDVERPKLVLGLRIFQLVVAIIVLALTAYADNWWSGFYHSWSPDQFNFLLFTAVWTLLALAYLVLSPVYFVTAAHKFGLLAAESLTMLFWFAGFIAVACFLSDRVCFGHVCNAAKAATVFGASEWLAFVFSFIMQTLIVVRSRRSGDPRPNEPEMAPYKV